MSTLASLEHAPHPAIEYRRCRNIDEQAMLLESWDQSYCQLSRGPFDGSVACLWVGGVRVLVERLNRAVYQRGQVASNKIAIGVPFVLEGHALLCGQTSHRDGLHVFSGNGGFEFLSPDKHVVLNLEIDRDALTTDWVRDQFAAMLPGIGTRPSVRNVEPERMQALRNTLDRLLNVVIRTPSLSNDPRSTASFEHSVVRGIAETLCDADPVDADAACGARTSRQWQLVRSVREHIENVPECIPSVADLCVRFHASRRTLQYAFEATLGLSPSAYVRAIRLGRVRREMADASSVTEAATRWGFWHLGNFSNEYRQQFGELPSETFRRIRRA